MTSMPWGKHRGTPLSQVPAGYLWWVIEASNAGADLRAGVRRELARRLGAEIDPAPGPLLPLPPDDPQTCTAVRDLVALGYRALARRSHPDTGGNHNAMLAATAAREWLSEWVPT